MLIVNLYLQVKEMDISRTTAELKLRECDGNVVEALIALTDWCQWLIDGSESSTQS